MENQVYRVNMEKSVDLEFYVCHTNEIEPYKSIREIGIQLIINDKQLDASLEPQELDSFIKYLIDCKNYITKFNKESIPEPNEK